MAFLKSIFGSPEDKLLKSWKVLVEQINGFESSLENLSPEELKGKTIEFKNRLREGESLDNLLPEAFAVVREASKRTLGQRHFDVQLLGGIALYKGGIAEMKTGEGKTLVATLPAYLMALVDKGVHVVTVNDYLSRRDAVWMGQIYSYLGLSIGVLNHAESFIYDESHTKDKERDELGSFHVVHEFLRPSTKKNVYRADITYGTNNEFGFDYLRDNLLYNKEDLSQRDYHYAIVDEIDSILIDEARTPLIISSNTGAAGELYEKFAKIARELKEETDFTVDEKLRAVSMTNDGINKAEKLLGIDNIYTEGGVKYVHHLETAVRAKALYHKDKEYVVKNNEVVIVDAFTGRLQPGRRWSEGLHQAIEAKEGVRIKEESRTFASVTFQNYFRMYQKLSGMTGTAVTSKEEFYKVYGLDTFVIPTNKQIARIDHGDFIFQTQIGKMKAVARKVKELNKKGQPVLIGTVSIENNELLSEYLKNEGIKHEVLNAKNHEREGEQIAQAGRIGAVTVATNMAGRGIDIKLGGIPSTKEEYEKVKEIGGLFVLGTERHDARRIDNQLRGRSGRQGDTGETQFFVSLEDSLMRIFAVDTIKKMMGRFNIPEDEPIENKLITNSLEKAQEKIEGFNFDARKHVLEFDDVLNFQRSIIYGRRRKILTGGQSEVKEYLTEAKEYLSPEMREKLDKKMLVISLEVSGVLEVLRRIILQTIDLFWVDHLEMMEYLRSSVNLRAYGQRDPLVEYKKDGLRFFRDMESSIAKQAVEFVLALNPEAASSFKTTSMEIEAKAVSDSSRPIVSKANVGRNDPCPCGSGKKYKKCHGANN
ncbi:MAG: Protein translocase subunit SecA [Parcubacteria group bacterium GW2011_GWB1_38_8]|uniref:Protein translocase subunit SecA n=2 Tax=Candidatus Zambryskiibacteriota TaxID=1817925 RepID=A0A1G2UGQ1_9BACT|nr:MAG: Protein translocase subunit SecA [Parcubacteria group bacterium GW2011_GWB1_38_8]KKR30407.1 MAG: Protein translocase subunit SecA [Parcubacteria group bacterium GW2011_GWC1_39_8]OHA94186.1 MAG: preprotein translocase subunit SecA [Candidatus Zambryskibacteria bacterium RIFCSPHIGHO2_02_FULL_39_16]OHB08350.1 MAG: preprotein translocase subunit SecA [Candidatus Zambryskibacteria bacterium RIFCSPLOWO2_02_FULL_39_14]